MKTHSLSLLAVASGAVLFCLAAPQPISGQDAAPAEVSPQLGALVAELTAQNKQLAANQAAMDAKVDEIAESIRQARLFVARAGRGGK
ncbi:MAG: hypothetical protein NTZ46_11050 [Verrucomicrobia bacterium]|nr:hypothetical protein [Verrucomicrobiota bacterium]